MPDFKERSRAYFDEHHASPFAHAGYWNRDYARTIYALELLRPASVVDIGCGPGAFLEMLHRAIPEVELHAMDLSEQMAAETAGRLGGAVHATAGDAEAMPFSDGCFEALTCNMSIHHYPHPQAAVDEMFRVLAPGGHVLINDMDCIAPVRAVANLVFPLLPGGDVKMYRKSEILEMLELAGFANPVWRKLSLFTFLCVAQKP